MADKKKPTNEPVARSFSEIEMQPPWGKFARFARGNVSIQRGAFLNSPVDVDSSDPEVVKLFIETRTKAHETYILETERTRRTALWLVSALLALGCLIPVFAPAGRETISYILSAALFIFSAGAVGYSSISFKDGQRQISASDGSEK